MRTHTQNKPLGNDAATDFALQQQARGQEELQFYDSSTIRVEQTTRGIRLHAKIPPPAARAAGGLHPAKPFLYNHESSYLRLEMIYIPASDPLVTVGTTDPDSKITVFAVPGTWFALRPVAPVVNPAGLPAGTYYRIPQLPNPVPGAPDNALNYWWLVTPDVNCYTY